MRNVIDILKERGLIDAMTADEISAMAARPLKVYCGFDPSADSLHVGNMVALMGLAWFQKCGHTPVAIIGGATGMIGDPSGKSSERQLLDQASIEKNVIGIRRNIEKFAKVDQSPSSAIILNNYDWFKDFSFIGFLRDVGKFFRIGPMLAKDSVKGRFTSEEGMSFTEFAYQTLQGYDFLYLFQKYGVTVQLGGSDQWGNITAGTELIRKVEGKQAYGITFPLLTKSDGQKFGKTEKGAIWLSSERLSPYEFYQSLVRVADADVINMMKMLTFMEMDEIRSYEKQMKEPEYVPNTAQKRLAAEITRIVHGEENLKIAIEVTEGAAPGASASLDANVLESLAHNMPSYTLKREEVVNVKLVDLIAKIGLQPSKGETRRLMRNGGVYLNNIKILDEAFSIADDLFIDGRLLLIALGKKQKALIKVE